MRLMLILALCCLAWLAPAISDAQKSIRVETARSTTPNGKPAAALIVNGKTVAQLAKDQRQHSPLHNISVAAALVLKAYRSESAELSVVQTNDSGRRFTLFLNGQVLLIATDQEGKAWGAAPEALANTWRKNLIDAWNLPVSSKTRPAADSPGSPPEPATGTLSIGSSVLRDTGMYADLTRSGGHSVYDPPGFTRLQSPQVPDTLTAQVTGRYGGAAAVKLSIESALRTYANAAPTAMLSWSIASPAGLPDSLSSGQQRKLVIDYTVSDRGNTSSGKAEMLLENKPIAAPRESITFFSNKPEGLTGPQLLYSGQLPGREAGRLVYHHQNQSPAELILVARLVNTSDEPAAAHIIPGTCDSDINTFYVGYKSAEEFWSNLNSNSGYVLSLPANSHVDLAYHRLQRGFTASGYFKITNLGDAPVSIETAAYKPGAPSPAGTAAGQASSRDVYPAPYISQVHTFNPGDPWLYLRLGGQSPQSLNGSNSLPGSYGFTYSFDVELYNQRETPALVFVVLRASAGEVKGQFYIDDEYVGTPLVSGGEEQLLKEIPLKPGQKQLLKIKAIPLNGGFYPASIILRQTRLP